MAGNKRSWEGNLIQRPQNDKDMADTEQTSPVQSLFMYFRNELDEHHDRRERIIKVSRDVTALSKKIIFSLHRIRNLNTPIPKSIAKENADRFSQIDTLFKSIAADVSGLNAWRYQHQTTWGVQEYIEALSFQHYIEKQRLITLEEVRSSLPPEILVTESDYVLGLFDLTGELMRFAITAMSMGGTRPRDTLASANVDGPSDVCGSGTSVEGIMVDLRELRAMFEKLNVPRNHSLMKDLSKKMEVMQASVEKVEKAAYGLLVRGKERPQGWMPDLSSSSAPVESY
ncbi:hypothetical protein D8B26_004401 [Coccidioides posadasii str. Silveira]|uniref:Translin-associated factor TraX n=2 Tax=Coccidioides posadasii TaxID=199306 RepID=E9DC51_COCPS|nr:Translin family protein [Coccidioides posadasii C735 delta SOWgp]EER23095.1 Translin family protein [Coccidioides posadasii C735 delta SOWgp]EFW15776.1 translin-associated factor TraX [Coccidioides posadasii str. Silveira]QVM09744.1 hypothetical protein D8B26_004401 [Coccidioides posadasii str. Silveira]|eukprot:XP_003065240.1 Translin family protein [Coccidioides posadasii C735 delta SOWgp]